MIKPQDLVIWYIYLLRNRQQKDQAWQWLKANFSRIREMFSENKDYADFVNLTGAVFYTDEDKEQFIEIFSPYKDDLAMKRIYQIGLNSISDKNSLHKKQSQLVRDKIDGLMPM